VELKLMHLNKSWIGLAVMLAASAPAQAAVVFHMQEVGNTVTLTGSGTLDISGLTPSVIGILPYGMGPDERSFRVGQALTLQAFTGLTGPANFGPGQWEYPLEAWSGDTFGMHGSYLTLPQGYVSGSLLWGSSNLQHGESLASLGATVGTYTWSWGSGTHADSITLIVGNPVSAVPEPSAYLLALAGLGVMGFWGRRQKVNPRQAAASAV
jgi:hypothetical protein